MLKNIFRLDGKVIVITGAAGLLGRKHAEAIACYGGTPILLDLSEQAVNKLADELNNKYNVDSVGFSIDITNEDAIENNVNQVIKLFGKKIFSIFLNFSFTLSITCLIKLFDPSFARFLSSPNLFDFPPARITAKILLSFILQNIKHKSFN